MCGDLEDSWVGWLFGLVSCYLLLWSVRHVQSRLCLRRVVPVKERVLIVVHLKVSPILLPMHLRACFHVRLGLVR